MVARGGSPNAISLGGREFPFTADSKPKLKIGGVEVAIEMNGNGTHRELYTDIPWELMDGEIQINQDNDDHEYLVQWQEGGGGDVGMSFKHGVEYQGTGNIIGTVEVDIADAKASISVGGGGKAKKL